MASFLSSIVLPIAVARRRAGPAARPHQHDAGRLAEPFAESDAAAGAAAVRRHRHHHGRGLGDGQIKAGKRQAPWSCSIASIRKTGDDGTTALGSGERRPKYDLRIAAYGTVDETNAAIGVVRLHLADARELDAMLGLIQNDLFDLGADLAVPQREGKAERLRMLSSQVERLERDIDTPERPSGAADLVRAARAAPRRRPICISPAPYAAGRNGSWWNSPPSPRSRSARPPSSI